LISPTTFEALRTELTERYGAELYYPNPDVPYWRSSYRGAPREPLDINERLRAAGIDLQLYVLRRDLDPNSMVEVVRKLRSRLPDSGTDSDNDPGFGININHVMFAEQFYHPGPDGFPSPDGSPGSNPGPASQSHSVDVAVLDTGVWLGWETVHPELNGNVQRDPDDTDVLDVTQPLGGLDSAAGHGLFIIGLIHRMDRELQVDPGKVMTPTGDGDDATVGAELVGNTAPVINLSFGCRTENNQAPPIIAERITNLIRNDRVVVAAAGNNGTDTEFWPAAMPEVIAVGSWVDSTGGMQKAPSSNYGGWVDVYARGVNLLSAYVNNRTGSNGAQFTTGWARWSGTSFATPQVAAEIASRVRNAPPPTPTVPKPTNQEIASNMLNALPSVPSAWRVVGKLFVGMDLRS
jgi:hypothetical protein